MTGELSYEHTLREVTTPKGVLRYHEAGAPHWPTVLFLHGSGPGVTGWRNFRGNLPAFAEFFHCLVLELPGFGVSDDFGGHPMFDAQEAAVAFLDALGLGSVMVIGNSMGGIVGANLAIQHPDRVAKLVTIGGLGTSTLGTAPSEGIRLLVEFTDEPSKDALIRWLRSMVHDQALITEELIAQRWELATDPATLAGARRMYGSAAMAATAEAAARSPHPPYWARLHKIIAPTLLTWGRDDRVSPLDMSLLPLRTIPGAELHVFGHCGHWVMIEAKEAFERTVIPFLTR
ncbi:alpha/beta fold hydrolase [Saccharomonospora sp. NPDC006951]